MNIVFLGGGSLRILPIVRELLGSAGVFPSGSIRLVDFNTKRAEAVGNMIRKTPEFAVNPCAILVTDNLDLALEGADIFYLTMAVEREPSHIRAMQLSDRYGFICSDQLSLNGAFLAARAGGWIMNFARKMEKICPQALMLVFANPVAVYSAAVNNFTKIKALGICGGFANHNYDIPRLLGRDAFMPSSELKVTACGVNHLSFILRGTYQGRDLGQLLQENIGMDYQPMTAIDHPDAASIRAGLKLMADVYRRSGTLIFSSESDGLAHLAPESYLQRQRAAIRNIHDIASYIAAKKAQAEAEFGEFTRTADSITAADYGRLEQTSPHYQRSCGDILIPIVRALKGDGELQIVASRPNCGAVRGFTDNMSLEYTMTIKNTTITPVANQYIPAPFYGTVGAFSEHHTLLAEAVAGNCGKTFIQALMAYPEQQFTAANKDYLRQMFAIYDDLIPEFKNAAELL